MTRSAIAQPQAALAFDQMAKDYDEVFTRSLIGRAQRDAVWNMLTKTFRSGDHILELNCGTGEDALFLARNSIAVTACDASQQMIQIASRRLKAESPNALVQFHLLPTEQVSQLSPEVPFDGAFSNFSGLNCVAESVNKPANTWQPSCPRALLWSYVSPHVSASGRSSGFFSTETSAKPFADLPVKPQPKSARWL